VPVRSKKLNVKRQQKSMNTGTEGVPASMNWTREKTTGQQIRQTQKHVEKKSDGERDLNAGELGEQDTGVGGESEINVA